MKVLMITNYEYPHVGGLSTHMSLIKKGLLENDIDVEILSMSNINKILRIILSSIPCKLISLFNKNLGTLWFNTMNQLLLALAIVYKIFKGNKFDIINCQDALSGEVALKLNKILKVRIIFTVHGYFVRQSISNGILSQDSLISKYYMNMERRVYENVNSIISVDSRIKDYINSHCKADIKNKISVLKNFIDTDIFTNQNENKHSLRKKWNIPSDKFVLLCPRRLVPKNGVMYPLHSMELLKENNDFILIYAGDGQEKENMIKYISEKKLQEQVLMLGNVRHVEMVELYDLSDVIIVPSINSAGVEEATSISAIEGMASGKVVIASEIGGLKELISHGENGILVKEKDVEDLANNVLSIREDVEKRTYIEKNARNTVENELSLTKRINDYLKIFKEVLN